MEHTKEELIKLWTNPDKRREFVKNYQEWGVWLNVPELGLTYYKYELPDGGKILAMQYRCESSYPLPGEDKIQTRTVYYLWDGEFFIPSSASEFTLIDRLKSLKVTLQKELRGESAE